MLFEKKKIPIEAAKESKLTQENLYIQEKLKGLEEKFDMILDLMHGNNYIQTLDTEVNTEKKNLSFWTETNSIPINEIRVLSVGGGILTLYINNSNGIIVAAGDEFTGEFYKIEYTQTIGAGTLLLQTRIRR